MHLQTLAAALFTLALSGCAQLQSVKPNTPVADVIKQFGKPTTVCRNQDGTERLVWSQQPFGHYAWGDHNLLWSCDGFEPTGTWSDERVRCEFGPPANIEGIAKGNEKVWGYRYMQFSAWYAMMYVYMGPNGNLANRHHPGPDPALLLADR